MKKKITILGIILIIVISLFAQEKKVYLTSLEWPPYTGQSLTGQGASVIIAQAAFKVMGYELEVDFYPWQRAVYLAKSSNKYSGYFPEYYDASVAEEFIYSDPMGISPLGFAENKSNIIEWNTLDDLKNEPIGIVSGYVNTNDFDAMVANGSLIVDPVSDDLTNLVKIGKKRIPLAVIDKYVLNYLLLTESSLQESKTDIQFNKKMLEEKKLYICFKNDAQGKKLSEIFNQGLKKIDVESISEDYFNKLFNK